MREEIAAAVVFLTRIVKKNTNLSAEQVQDFSNKLSANLVEKFKNHWYQDNPLKGQGYRCIRINETDPVDPMLEQAAQDSGLKYRDLQLPLELTLWVDPKEVCCRFGEINGMYCTLASFQDGGEVANKAGLVDIDNLLERNQHRKVTNNAYHFRSTYRPPPPPHYVVNNNNNNQQQPPARQVSPTWHNNLHNQVVNANHQRVPGPRPYNKGIVMRSPQPMRPPPAIQPIQGDKYRWVRGADLIRA